MYLFKNAVEHIRAFINLTQRANGAHWSLTRSKLHLGRLISAPERENCYSVVRGLQISSGVIFSR